MSKYFGNEVFKLGFGLMRLPQLINGKIDIEQTIKMVDMFLEAGGTYFDTAYVYEGSEEAIRQALVERVPRESYTLTTKLCAWLQCHDEQSAKQQFYTSLERTGVDYFDYYLLHALQANNYKKYDEYHIWEFAKELKEKGLIKHYGFSYHADSKLLDDLLTKHPDVDFIQLQINYADWNNPDVESRKNYEVARKHGVSITVMEPVKGGVLANPPKNVQQLFTKFNPEASFASWAIRYVASMDGIITVLSGMSNIEQMEDNLSYMKNFQPLSSEEQSIIHRAQALLDESKAIKCTGCHYCTKDCPIQIPIPEIFSAMNLYLLDGDEKGAKEAYDMATKNVGKASDCIQCEQCESSCPQQLNCIEHLQQCADFLE